MADSKRQKIVDQIVARMATILTVNGYETDLGEIVAEWRTQWQEEDFEDSDGAISVCDMVAETPEVEGRSNPRETVWIMPVQIRMYFKKETTISNVRRGIQDVNRAIRQDDRWKVDDVGLVMISRPRREGPEINPETFEINAGVVEFDVQYITAKFNSEE